MESKAQAMDAIQRLETGTIFLNSGIVGYIQGAKSINPDIEVKVAYSESFGEPAKGQQVAKARLGEGAGIVDIDAFIDLDALEFGLDQPKRGQAFLVPGFHGGLHGRLDGINERLLAHGLVARA